MHAVTDRISLIRQGNDILRSSMLAGNVIMNGGFCALPRGECAALEARVRTTRDFDPTTADTRASGSVRLQHLQVRWRSLCLAPTLTKPSADASDPYQTHRCLHLDLVPPGASSSQARPAM